LRKLLPCILFEKYINILALEMASAGNRQCADFIGALSFPMQGTVWTTETKIPGYAADDDGGDADVRQDTVRFRRRLAAAYGRFGERLALARQLSAVRASSNETATDAD